MNSETYDANTDSSHVLAGTIVCILFLIYQWAQYQAHCHNAYNSPLRAHYPLFCLSFSASTRSRCMFILICTCMSTWVGGQGLFEKGLILLLLPYCDVAVTASSMDLRTRPSTKECKGEKNREREREWERVGGVERERVRDRSG